MSGKRYLIAFFIVFLFWAGLPVSDCPAGNEEKAGLLTDQALALYRQGKYKEAIPLAAEALGIWEKEFGPDDPATAAGLALLAGLNDAAGQYDEAVKLYKRALLINEKAYGPESIETAAAANNLGAVYYNKGEYALAEPLYKKSLSIRERLLGADHPDTAVSLNNMAALYDAAGDYEKAEKFYKKSLAAREKHYGPHNPRVAVVLNNLAALYETMGRYENAKSMYKRALSIQEKEYGARHPQLAVTVNNLAFLYDSLGDYEKAESLYKRALEIRIKSLGEEHPETAVSLNNLAELYLAAGDSEQAERYHKKSLAVREKALGPAHPDVAQSLNNLANVYTYRGEYTGAEDMLIKAVDIWEKSYGPDHPETASGLNNLAELYKTLGDYEKASPLYDKALAIREKVFGPDHPLTALSLNNKAGYYDVMKDYDKAAAMLEKAILIWEKALGPEHPHVAAALNNLAGIHFSAGHWTRAEILDRRALEIRKKVFGSNHPQTAQSLNNLAGFHFAMGDAARAESLYRESLDILKKTMGPEHPEATRVIGNLAVLHASKGDYRRAFERLSDIQRIDGRFIEQIMGFTSEDQKLKFMATKRRELDAYFSLVAKYLIDDGQVRRKALDVWLRRKGIILEAQKRFLEALVYRDAPEVRASFQELARLRSRLSRLVFSGPGKSGPEAYRKRINDLEERINRIESELVKMSRSYALQKEVGRADSARVAASLPKGSVLLDFVRTGVYNFESVKPSERWLPDRYLAFVLHAGKPGRVGLIDLGEAKKVDDEIAGFKKKVVDFSDSEGLEASLGAGRLYDLVFEPILKEIGTANEIYISPDGNLNLIPFEVLQRPDGRYLIEDYSFNYLSAGRDVIGFDSESRADAGGASRRSVIIGDPDFDLDGGQKTETLKRMGLKDEAAPASRGYYRSVDLRDLVFSPLEGTRDEALAIRDIIGPDKVKVYLGTEALEEVVQGVESPPILHMATHGFFLKDLYADSVEQRNTPDSGSVISNTVSVEQGDMENPLVRSGLALAGANKSLSGGVSSDGLLTAEKVLSLKLGRTDLVVLSACQTGLGEVQNGEGVYGLRRAFTQAGAKGLVLSMWSVPDLETKELMVEFYRNIEKGKMKRSSALRQAALSQMHKVKARYGHANPFYWGAFVFLGKP